MYVSMLYLVAMCLSVKNKAEKYLYRLPKHCSVPNVLNTI